MRPPARTGRADVPEFLQAARIRPPRLLYRHTSFGTQGDAGSRAVERLLTVVATCRQRQRSVLAYLTAALEAALQGQPALTSA